jgi:hypothetical protein
MSTEKRAMPTDYPTGLFIAKIVGVCGKLTVLAGAVVALASFYQVTTGYYGGGLLQGLFAMLPGVAVAAGGMMTILSAHLAEAIFAAATSSRAVAENSIAILEQLRIRGADEQLEISEPLEM